MTPDFTFIKKNMKNNALYFAALKIVKILFQKGFTAYFAGGCVRDSLLDRKFSDIDIATNAQPNDVVQLFQQTKLVGAHFGVVLVSLKNHTFEVATFRKDGIYSDGRHPDSITFTDAKEDAQRRDFTINGLFYDPIEDKILDYVNGLQDIQQRIIRPIGDPQKRFMEDKLRLLRYIRFYAQLNTYQFQLDSSILQIIQKMASTLKMVSKERIREELFKIFQFSNNKKPLEYLIQTELFQQIVPWEIHELNLIFYESLLSKNLPPEILFFSLFWDFPNWSEIHRYFLLTKKEYELTLSCQQFLTFIIENDSMDLSAKKKMLRSPYFQILMQFAQSYCQILKPEYQEKYDKICQEYVDLKDNLFPKKYITGNTLKNYGLRPSPFFKILLDAIENAQLNEEITTRRECEDYLKTLLDKNHIKTL